MKKLISPFLKKILGLLIIFLAIVATTLFSLYLNQVLASSTQNQIKHSVTEITTYLDNRLRDLRKSLDSIKNNEELRLAIEKQDPLEIEKFFEKTTRKDGFRLALVTDNNGIVIYRAENKNVLGDYVFNYNPWGQAVIRGEEISVIEKSSLMQMIAVAGSPLRDQNGDFLAGIFIGEKIDQDLAQKLKNLEEENNIEIAFYTKEDGIFASSLNSQEEENTIKRFFNEGSEWIKNSRGIDDIERLRLDKYKNYYLKNIVFDGLRQSPGGMLLLFEDLKEKKNLPILAGFLILTPIVWLALSLISQNRMEKIIFLLMAWLSFGLLGAGIYPKMKNQGATNIGYDNNIVYNSTVKLEPETGVFKKNTEHEIKIIINTAGEEINAVNFVLRYNPAMVQASSINTDNSICPRDGFLEKEINDQEGLIKISCIIFKKGFSGTQGEVAGLKFKTVREGRYVLRFDQESSVFANDGLGTEVLRSMRGGSYQIIDPASRKQSLSEILIFSSTHPNETRWYKNKEAAMSWMPLDTIYDQYRWLVSSSSDSILDWKNSKSIKENHIEISDLAEGENYFHIIGEKDGLLGPESKFRIKIDNTPPEPIKIKITSLDAKVGDLVRLSFTGEDRISGIQSFYAKINNHNYFPVDSPFFIPFTVAGKYYLSIRAFDQAENHRDTEIVINVSGKNFLEEIFNFGSDQILLLSNILGIR